MKALAKSFVYAWNGFVFCVEHERNMRIHLCVAAYMYGYLLIYDFFKLTRSDFAVLFIITAMVFAAEMINTAVEKTVDLCTAEYRRLAKVAKDAAAGGVLAAAVASVGVGLAILYQPEAFSALGNYYARNPIMLAVLLLSLLVSFIFVFAGPAGIKGFFKRHKKEK